MKTSVTESVIQVQCYSGKDGYETENHYSTEKL